LFFDDVIVIDQPFSGGRDRAPFAQRVDERFVGRFKFASVVFEARQELGAAFTSDGFVFGSECLLVLFEEFDAEELCLERLLVGIAFWLS
jgi:hypothetical protein